MSDRAWQAKWIGAEFERPLPMFRRVFQLDKTVSSATCHICALGQFELQVNGMKAGDAVMEPGWTNYRRSCLYVTHDVAPLIHPGENTITVLLGNGMYNVPSSKRYKKFKATFGPPKLIAELHLQFTDGTSTVIATDDSWQVAPGPITFSCIYGGEDHDARLENPTDWRPAKIVDGPGGELVPQESPPIRVIETYKPANVSEPRPGIRVIDLGQNLSGWPKITVQGPAGATVKLTTAEIRGDDGMPNQRPIGSPSYFSYTLRGAGVETWRPRFTYTGFRYVQVEAPPDVRVDVEGQFITAAKVTGQFECSSDLFNRIHRLINMAIRSNFQSVLTDCPHREKLGWLEQDHLMGPSLMYNYDMRQTFHKICRDMREAQLENGCVPTIAPQYTSFNPPWEVFNDSPEWGSAAVICPWLTYQRYGDRQILQDNYDMMKRYVEYLHGRDADGVIDFGLGDWYDIGEGKPGFAKLTSIGLTATAIYFCDVEIMRQVSQLLGHDDDVPRWIAYSQRIRAGFNAKFFNPTTQQYDRGSQTAHAMPLACGLVPPEHRAAVLENLIRDIRAHDNHITAGDIGFHFVIRALSEAGRSDVIYDLLSRTDPPSYGAQLAAGATTLTEAWDAYKGASQNHLMLGHAESWFYDSLAGIQIDMSKPQGEQIVIKPAIVGDITWAKAHCEAGLGKVQVEWRLAKGKVHLIGQVPAPATVQLPDGTLQRVAAGEFDFAPQ